MTTLYPLRFRPIFRRYIWGGRRLETVLGKTIGPGDDYAESWEIVDHGDDQSVVSDGWLAGTTLGELLDGHGRQLLGKHFPQKPFPLLFKFLDAQRDLSVQVHPDDERARMLDPPDLGKTEAWFILHADPGAVIYAGLKRGFDRQALEREIHRGTTELCLNRIEPQPGQCVFIPAGVVHALGAGLVVAEIQQASDTTFRIYDWNRVGPDGKPRALHVAQGLDAINFDYGPVVPQTPQDTVDEHVKRLVECQKFVLERWELAGPARLPGAERFHIVACVSGQVRLDDDPAPTPLQLGQTALLPASSTDWRLSAVGNATLLVMYLP